ncbi:MAG: glycosyl hydrolase 108 family protein [Steroidobacteraceae bacterium]
MPSAAFTSALPFVLRWEGGFVNHPNDPGGATNRGVTQAVYDAWRGTQGLALQSVELITGAEVDTIYESRYWLPAHSHDLQTPLDLVQFDTSVNMGVNRAVRFLQHVVGCGVDGAFGKGTAAAVAACDQGQAVIDYCKARESYYRMLAERNPKLAVFLKGWLNRLNALRKEAGLPGYERAAPLDFGETGYIMKIPDLGVDQKYDF